MPNLGLPFRSARPPRRGEPSVSAALPKDLDLVVFFLL
jgi:hypothetical protein